MDFDSLVPESTPIEVVEKVEEDKECDPWLWNGKPIYTIPTEHETFVYLITNKINGKRYVGFKTSVSQKTKVVNKRRKSARSKAIGKVIGQVVRIYKRMCESMERKTSCAKSCGLA